MLIYLPLAVLCCVLVPWVQNYSEVMYVGELEVEVIQQR
jgi:hypothetical protein